MNLRPNAVLVAFFVLAASRLFAGEPTPPATDAATFTSEPRIRVVIPSLVEVERKLKWLIELNADIQLRKQWRKLKEDLIDAFTDGVSAKQPIEADLVFGPQGASYELRIPILDFASETGGFLSGLRGRSYKVKMIDDGIYEILEKDKKPTHMVFDNGYAWIATGDRLLPTRPTSATADLGPILSLNKDIVAEIRNSSNEIALRRATFEAFRHHVERTSRKRKSESQNTFDFRQLWVKQVMREAEPWLVESEHVQVSWIINTSAAHGYGRGEVSLTALPGSDLAREIDETAARPGVFANVKSHDNRLAAVKLSINIGRNRRAQLKEFYKSLLPILDAEIETRSSQTGREALKRAITMVLTMLDEGADTGSVDAFAELFASPARKNILLCGLRAADGKSADEIVRLVPKFGTDWKIKLNVHEHSGVTIHELTVGTQQLASFQCVFAGENVLYVGSGQNAVWIAAGNQSLNHLRIAIDQATRPPEKLEPVVFRYEVDVGQLVTLFDSIRKQQSLRDTALTQDQRQLRKEVDKYLKLAHDAMSGCEASTSGELRRTGNGIEGFAQLNECTLRCIGAILAGTLKDLE